jgi:hypothetical protein
MTWVVSTLPAFAPASTPSSPIASRSSFWQTAMQRFTSLAFLYRATLQSTLAVSPAMATIRVAWEASQPVPMN